MSSRLLPIYFLFQATSTSVFSSSIFVVFYEEHVGLTLAVILGLQSYTTAVRALLELPCGALADRWSRRGCLVLSGTALGVASTLLVVWPTFATAVLAETLFASCSALRSGADSALLFDTLRVEERGAEYPGAESRAHAVASMGSAVAAIAGGLLAGVDLRLPYAATALAALATVIVASMLVEKRPADAGGPRGTLAEAAATALRTPVIRWAMGLAAFAVVLSHVYFFLQQPYLKAIGVPVAVFGFVFAATKAVTAIVATQAHRVDDVLGQRATAGLMAVVAAVGLGGMALVAGPIGAVLILTRGALDGLWMPLTNIYLNRVVSSRLRATMLSLQNLGSRLTLAAMLAGLGLVTGVLALDTTLALTALAAVVGGAVLVASHARVRAV